MSGRGYMGADEILGAMQDILGGQEILGESDQEMVDAILSGEEKQTLARVASKMRNARAVDPNAVYVKEREPRQRLRAVAGFGRTVVAAGAVGNPRISPQELFRPERLSVSSAIAVFFGITQVNVGQRSQLVAAGEMNADAFTEVAVDNYVQWDTCNIGNFVELVIVNNSGVSQTFTATAFGTMVK